MDAFENGNFYMDGDGNYCNFLPIVAVGTGISSLKNKFDKKKELAAANQRLAAWAKIFPVSNDANKLISTIEKANVQLQKIAKQVQAGGGTAAYFSAQGMSLYQYVAFLKSHLKSIPKVTSSGGTVTEQAGQKAEYSSRQGNSSGGNVNETEPQSTAIPPIVENVFGDMPPPPPIVVSGVPKLDESSYIPETEISEQSARAIPIGKKTDENEPTNEKNAVGNTVEINAAPVVKDSNKKWITYVVIAGIALVAIKMFKSSK